MSTNYRTASYPISSLHLISWLLGRKPISYSSPRPYPHRMSQRIVNLAERYDALKQGREQDFVDRLDRDLERNYDALTKRLLSQYDEMSSRADLVEAARLIQVKAQLGEALGIVPPTATTEERYRSLYVELERLGGEYAVETLREMGVKNLDTVSGLPLEAMAAAATESASRLERHGQDFADNAARTISTGIAQGIPYRAVAQELQKLKNLTRYQAERIARTEGNRAYVDAQKTRYEQRGIKAARWLAVGDELVCPYCSARNGLIYAITDIVMPVHPLDRCTTVPVSSRFNNSDEFYQQYRDDGLERLKAAGRTPNNGPGAFETAAPTALSLDDVRKLETPQPTPKPSPTPAPTPTPVPTASTPSITSYTQLVERGREESAIFGFNAEEFSERQTEFNELLARIHSLTDEKYELDKRTKKGKQRLAEIKSEVDQLRVRRKEVEEVQLQEMALLRRSMMRRLTASDARELASDIPYERNGNENAPKEQELRFALAELFRLSGGRGYKKLRSVEYLDRRAYANPNGTLNIGETAGNDAVLWHEMGHMIEFELSLGEIMEQFVLARATGSEVGLNKLMNSTFYRPDEKAFPDEFISPYVGKVYRGRYTDKSNRATEVLSMGVERFITSDAMVDFYAQDPEHFFLTIGALNTNEDEI